MQQLIESSFARAVALHQSGDMAGAESVYLDILKKQPTHVASLGNLAALQLDQGRVLEAERLLQATLSQFPKNASAWTTLSNLLYQRDELEEAEAAAREALKADPNYVAAWLNLSAIFASGRKWQKSLEASKAAMTLQPANAEAKQNAANAYLKLRQFPAAEKLYREALPTHPDQYRVLHDYAQFLKISGRMFDAKNYFERAIAAAGNGVDSDIFINYAAVLMNLGHQEQAIQALCRSIELKPAENWFAWNSLLFNLNYHPHLGERELYGWYRRFGEEVQTAVAAKVMSHGGWQWDGQRKLRIGYLSPDFKGHACRYFMEPFLREHDRSRFELYAYANVEGQDAHTERLKGYFDRWRDILLVPDDEVAAQIAADRIDILVDLAGHTAGNMLMVLARKPAPIQATYMGYGYTTGLKSIDYYLCDEQMVPPGSEHLFSEAPWRLPVANCYEPDRSQALQVNGLPALTKGYVTFGSLTRPVRINERVIAAWSEILKRVPGAKLMLDQAPFQEEGTRELFWERFAGCGIEKERVILNYSNPHWQAYHHIDIALDPFPHNAGTTTLEAMWMGVPVLSKRDRPSVGRLGACALHAVGMDDWLVDTEDAYIDEAVRRAADLHALAETRATLRTRMEDSPLLQATMFTRNLEQAYRDMAMRKMEQVSIVEQARDALPQIQAALLQGNFQDAEAVLDAVLTILGDDAEALNMAVMAALGQSKLPQAKDFADRLLGVRPGWNEALLTAAHVAMLTGDAGRARALVDKILEAEPTHAAALALRQELPADSIKDADTDPVPAGPPAATAARPIMKGSAAQLIEQGKKEFGAGRFQQALDYFDHVLNSQPKHPVALHLKAVALMQLGRLADSRQIFDEAIKLRAGHADIWDHFGSLLLRLGEREAACNAYKKAVSLNPRYDSALNNLGQLHIEEGQFDTAEEFIRKALAVNPARMEALNNLGTIQIQKARHADAAATLRHAVQLHPGYASAWQNLGVAEKNLGKAAEAEACYRRALELNSDIPDAWKNLSALLEEQRRWDEAEHAADSGLAIAHGNAALLAQKGNVLVGRTRYEEAIPYFAQAIAVGPATAKLYTNLGLAHFHLMHYEEALRCYRIALEMEPRYALAWNNLAGVLKKKKNTFEAMAAYQKALECDPGFAEVYSNLGACLMVLVRLDEALELFKKSIELKPQFTGARSNLLFCLNYHPTLSAEEIYAWYRRCGEELEGAVAGKVMSHGDWQWDGQRKLRIGYLSPDFKGHACRFFMEAFLREHDRNRFELFAYANVSEPDAHTERLKGYFDGWRDIVPISDDEAAGQIAADRIDILVDLAGHTDGNRLMACARKPAPIQVTHMGYGYTTGLKAIDYFLCDEQLVPPGSEHLFSETPWRLPLASCYEADRDAPPVADLPALRNGHVTFGSLVRTVRINERVIAAWSAILKRVPGSKLRLNQAPFQEAPARELFWERFAQHGIEREQVILEYSSPHWPAYQQIDIALDPFPHNGGTTTLEALWMGVPVLSKRDRPSVGRLGACALHAAGMNDWLVDTEQDYIDTAVRRAADTQELARLRGGLRQRIQDSLLSQPASYTRSLEQAFQQMAAKRTEERT